MPLRGALGSHVGVAAGFAAAAATGPAAAGGRFYGGLTPPAALQNASKGARYLAWVRDGLPGFRPVTAYCIGGAVEQFAAAVGALRARARARRTHGYSSKRMIPRAATGRTAVTSEWVSDDVCL